MDVLNLADDTGLFVDLLTRAPTAAGDVGLTADQMAAYRRLADQYNRILNDGSGIDRYKYDGR